VSVLDADTRPDLDAGLRAFARGVRPGADVAVLLLDEIRPTEGGLALLPAGAAAASAETEGVRPADALRRAVERGPKDLVVVGDACSGDEAACAAGLAALPRGVSAILARRSTDAPGTLRPELLPAMTVEGRTFAQLSAALADRLKGSEAGLFATPTLTPSFAFLPAGFLAGLQLACNGVDPGLSAEALRDRPSLQPLVTACGEAAARYGFSPFFAAKLGVVRDQEAARRGFGSCADASAYLAAFPEGRYRPAVEARRLACAAPPPAPAPSPVSAPAPNALDLRARAAVTDYFRRHDYVQGASFSALARLYPPQLRVRHAATTAAEHLRRLGAWYGAYDDVRFSVLPDSLDLSGCGRPEDCRVRGRYQSKLLRAGVDNFEAREGDFSLRLDLGAGQVLAECGVAEASDAGPCE